MYCIMYVYMNDYVCIVYINDYVCMYVLYICMYVCMYVCMYGLNLISRVGGYKLRIINFGRRDLYSNSKVEFELGGVPIS